MKGDAFLVPFPPADIELFSSVTVPTAVTAVADLRWKSASRHFAMQMPGKKRPVCVSVTVILLPTITQRHSVFSEAHFKHSPGAVCLCSGHVCLSACIFHRTSDFVSRRTRRE